MIGDASQAGEGQEGAPSQLIIKKTPPLLSFPFLGIDYKGSPPFAEVGGDASVDRGAVIKGTQIPLQRLALLPTFKKADLYC